MDEMLKLKRKLMLYIPFKTKLRIEALLATFSIIARYAKLSLGSENTFPPDLSKFKIKIGHRSK
jgi:hypothetical protein